MQVAEHTAPKKRARSDFRHTADKAACRAFNLAALDGSLCVADAPQRLWLDWCELAGEGNPTVDLLAPMLGPGRFIGVDTDRGVIARNKARGIPHTIWLHGRLQTLLANAPEEFGRVAVMNYDSFEGWHADRIVAETAPLVEFAARQLQRHGEFVLIINAATRNHDRSVVMRRVQRVFSPLLAPFGREVVDTDVCWYTAAGERDKMCNVRVRLGFQ